MPVTLIGVSSGVVWGITAEVGLIAQSANVKSTREKNSVRNESGEFVLVSFFNQLQNYVIEGVFTGSSGISAASPGYALAIANTNTTNGVTGGGVYCDDVDIKRVNTDFKRISANATQYPLIA